MKVRWPYTGVNQRQKKIATLFSSFFNANFKNNWETIYTLIKTKAVTNLSVINESRISFDENNDKCW